MRILLTFFAITSTMIMAVAANTSEQDENFYIFLCFGQSNMEGYPGIPDSEKDPVDPRFQVLAAVDFPEMGRKKGHWYTATPPLSRPPAGLSPADYFGRTMVRSLPKEVKVGVINVAVGGTKIEIFDPATRESYLADAPDWLHSISSAYDKDPYKRLVEMAKIAQKDGIIKGILMHQGESNTGDRQWPVKVKTIYENLLHDLVLEAEKVPLIAGEVVSADQNGKCASMNEIIRTLPDTIPTAHVVSSQGCPDTADDLHFSPEGYKMLGERYAVTMLSLLSNE